MPAAACVLSFLQTLTASGKYECRGRREEDQRGVNAEMTADRDVLKNPT